jgi:hypothetical protein
VSTGLVSASCGLSTNVWGQVTAVSSSGYANLCLQCRVNVLGVTVSFGYYSALAASINAYGVSASQIAVLQSSIDVSSLSLPSFLIAFFLDVFHTRTHLSYSHPPIIRIFITKRALSLPCQPNKRLVLAARQLARLIHVCFFFLAHNVA